MKLHFTLLFFLMLAFSACEDNSTETSSIGTLNGKAYLIDEKGLRIKDHSGITVSLKERPISTTTTASGSWQLTNVPMGTYTILFSKPGFDTSKIFGFQFNGYGDVLVDEMTDLLKLVSGRIEQLSLSTTKTNTDSVAVDMFTIQPTFSHDVRFVEGEIRYFLNISTKENSAFEDTEDSKLFSMTYNQSFKQHRIYMSELKRFFNSGTNVYVTARIAHYSYRVKYDNFGNKYYVGLGEPSPTVTFVIP